MIIDISRRLERSMAVWPGGDPFQLIQTMEIERGAAVNVTTLRTSVHAGTHADAPYHFSAAGAKIDAVDLALYWGKAQVVSIPNASGPLTPADFNEVDLSLAPRLLVHSPASEADPDHFPEMYVYPSPELADYLAIFGIVLWGTDSPSVDTVDSKQLPGHHALLTHQIAILEGLDLSRADDGLYELVALPLKIVGGDGSPVRAALKPIQS